ncbi:hypothetical protein [Thermotalea metallivorans]|uniref:Uncharacterized protein n=1 Tax=Thermotalea metallivorans TaxID=520762 RepID=A0A140L0G5_9FIRM|nr:hypothetical protein [Thermotalea metallivorans]KXG74040.1 hypothetical protein AN619_26500 [Thermotalea metallivorans]
MNKPFVKSIILWLILSVFLFSPVHAGEGKKVVLITINEVNFEDLYSIHSIKEMINSGAIALMNNRTSTRANIYKAYATIGTGVRAEASSDSIKCENVTKENSSVYQRRMGFSPGNEGIVNLEMAKLIKLNMEGEYGAVPGALGQALHNAGMRTAALGNGDTDDAMIRLAPIIAMDEKGYVDYGAVGPNLLEKNPMYPFGLKTNYEKLEEIFRDVWTKADFIAIDLGDIGRLERYKDYMSDARYLEQKKTILKDMDQFLGKLNTYIDFAHTRLILVSPYPSAANIKNGDRLTPIVVYGDGIQQGVITSSTTRREGIVGNVDIAPSILDYLGASSDVMTGRPMKYIPKQNNYAYILGFNEETVAISNHRYPVLSTFAIFEIIVSITALAIILMQNRLDKKLVNRFKNVLLSTMTVPFVLLILPVFVKKDLLMTYLLLIGITALLTFLSKKISREIIDSILMLSSMTTVGLLADIATGGKLIQSSLLGYDPIIGARYYGIGNEYMGVLIGAALVFSTTMIDRFQVNKIWCLAVFAVTIVIIGFPGLGANVGGTMTAVAAFVFVSLRLYKVRMRFKQFVIIGLTIVASVAIMAFVDIYWLGSKSHLAGAIQQIMTEGPRIILLIINRKIAMNLKLIGVTIWSKVLLSAIIILAILFYRPVGAVYKLTKLYPNLAIGWSGIVVACVVGFLVNDSGIVASATGIIFLAMSMLYLTFYIPREKD